MSRKYHFSLVLFFALLYSSDSLTAQSVKGYQLYQLSGYQVYVQKEALTADAKTTRQAIELLKNKLEEVNSLYMQARPKKYLKRVKFFMDLNNDPNKAAQYHVSRQWVVQHGLPPEMAKAIHITNIHNFINWTQLNQPYMILHEMAHAYHDVGLSYQNILVKQAYRRAVKKGIYENVWYNSGSGSNITKKRAYALNNVQEYFAEITEAFFGKNDYYPFNRNDLKTHDPKGYALMRFMWQGDKKPEELIPKNKQTNTQLKSTNSNIASRIHIINQRQEVIYGYWIDYQGQEKYYFMINPGQRLTQNTYVNHVWRIKNEAQKKLKEFTSNHPEQTIEIK
ncbi:hypothetical protein BKI52_43060 [marine bacterium AO1-C]|nr:hypothetical protein BKI52_43060 [marine bacterium AO1-C]